MYSLQRGRKSVTTTPKKMASRGLGTLILFAIFSLTVLVVATFVIVVKNGGGIDPPATVTVPSTLCDWCGDLTARIADVASPESRTRDAGACATLTQSDFDAGTFIADAPDACYTLGENIVFHPAPHKDFRATDEPYASDPAFVLDFPAAILVRAAGVSIDLAGHEIRQSRTHYVQQRFFAVVELTTPFIAGQGPADFVRGTAPVEAARFTLRNGRVGLSSHHGIHGNGAWSVLIEDVDIANYEVGAVAFNGVHDMVLRRVRALGTLSRVPVLATYSSARFMMPFVHRAVEAGRASSIGAVRGVADRLAAKGARLQSLMDDVATDVSSSGVIDKSRHGEAYALFGNPSGLPDGSASYGFIVHAHGVAVNGFECDRSDARNDHLHHILIEDCEVRNTLLHAVEVPVLQEVSSNNIQRGPAGDVLRVADLVSEGGGTAYAGTALSETKIALAEVVAAARLEGYGTLAVSPTVMRWSRGEASVLADAVASGAFRYMRNCDNMFHVNKGAFGIRIGGGHHIAVRRTSVNGVANTGDSANFDPLPGETAEDAYWTSGEDGGHPAADPQHGYGGADAHGIAIAAAAGVVLDAVTIRNVHARAGWAAALYIFNGAADVTVNDAGIFNVTAMTDPNLRIAGPKQPRAVGISVTTDAEPPTYTGTLEIKNIGAGRIGMACNKLVDNTGVDACSPAETNFYAL